MSQAISNAEVLDGHAWKPMLLGWWPAVLGLLLLYLPTLFDLATGPWRMADSAHGPIILALSSWLIARQWPAMMAASSGQCGALAGWPLTLIGLLMYLVGRSQGMPILEIASLVVMLAAILLIALGYRALKAQWFPLFFMLFMIPLPGEIIAVLTLPMKIAVSYVAENLLFLVGYPIGRSGVILQIGQYQLMVVDACAGLQTLLTLEALGLFYLNLVRHASAFRNVALALLIIPVSFAANVIRVIALTLITFHFGDAAGRGFLHGFAGVVLFATALIMIMGVDGMLQWIVRLRGRRVISSHGLAA